MLNVTPSLNNAFMAMVMEVFQDGALNTKTKELIAVAEVIAAGAVRSLAGGIEANGATR
jgi:alkylhydroperoxidase/carboxymuconolactone decarboxylase family protein YurZ